MNLGRGVSVARIKRRRLRNQSGDQIVPAGRAAWIETAGGQIFRGTWWRRNRSRPGGTRTRPRHTPPSRTHRRAVGLPQSRQLAARLRYRGRCSDVIVHVIEINAKTLGRQVNMAWQPCIAAQTRSRAMMSSRGSRAQSKTLTSAPARLSAPAVGRPMKPAPPVSNTFTGGRFGGLRQRHLKAATRLGVTNRNLALVGFHYTAGNGQAESGAPVGRASCGTTPPAGVEDPIQMRLRNAAAAVHHQNPYRAVLCTVG